MSSVEETFDGSAFYRTSYTYDTDNRPTILSYGSITGENSYDAYGRLWSNYLNHTSEDSGEGDAPVSMVMTTYGYTNPDDTHTSTQIRTLTNSVGTSYDRTYMISITFIMRYMKFLMILKFIERERKKCRII